MPPSPVTDPNILQQLNAPEQTGPSPVTNPALIQQLEAPEPTGPMSDIAQSLAAGDTADTAQTPLLAEALKGIPILGAYIPNFGGSKELEDIAPGVAKGARSAGAAVSMMPAIMAAPELFGLKAGASLAGNVLTGAGTGAVISGADAAARGEPIVSNAVTGALTGGAAPVAGKLIGSAFQGVLNALGPNAEGVLKGVNKQALQWASEAAKADGLSEPQIADAIKNKGAEAFLAEYSPRLKGAAAQVASLPGATAGKEAILGGIEARQAPEAVHGRIEKGINDMLGPPVNMTQQTLEDIEARGAEANPLFEKFKITQVQPTDAVKGLVTDLEEKVPGVFDDAKNLANLRSAETGRDITFDKKFFTTGERKDWPTTESWQMVKEAIDDRIANSYVNGQPSKTTGPLVGIKKRLDDVIGNANPEAASVWKQARDAWGTRTEIMKARNAGTNAWDPGYTKDQLLQDLTDLSPPERAAFKEGARASLAERMNRSVNGDTQVRNMMLAPANKAKMAMLAQKKGVDPDTFLRQMGQEKDFAQTQKDLGTSVQKQATKEMGEKLTPNPEDLAFNKIPHLYSPHVTPFRYIPGVSSIGKAFARRQNSQYEAARDALGTLLANKGPMAQEVARALLRYNPVNGQQIGMNTAGIVKALAQPNVQGTPVPGPAWLGGTTQ